MAGPKIDMQDRPKPDRYDAEGKPIYTIKEYLSPDVEEVQRYTPERDAEGFLKPIVGPAQLADALVEASPEDRLEFLNQYEPSYAQVVAARLRELTLTDRSPTGRLVGGAPKPKKAPEDWRQSAEKVANATMELFGSVLREPPNLNEPGAGSAFVPVSALPMTIQEAIRNADPSITGWDMRKLPERQKELLGQLAVTGHRERQQQGGAQGPQNVGPPPGVPPQPVGPPRPPPGGPPPQLPPQAAPQQAPLAAQVAEREAALDPGRY